MSRSISYRLLIAVSIYMLVGCRKNDVRLPSLRETYGKEDTKPFGGAVAFQQLKSAFADNYVQTAYEKFSDTWADNYSTSSGQHSLYVLIAKDVFMSSSDASSMRSFVEAGNDLFVSADFIDEDFLAEMSCNTERSEEISSEINGIMRYTSTKVAGETLADTAAFGYFYYPFQNHFSGYDFEHTKMLGVNENRKPNFIVIFFGSGRLYLHSAPRAFSNYFLLSKSNYKYLEQVIGLLRSSPKNIFWDEYYKYQNVSSRKQESSGGSGGSGGSSSSDQNSSGGRNKKSNFSSFNVINEHEELKWAFWLGLLLLLLFALFNMKRRQRIVPKTDPNINTSVAFTETIGRLYLQKKNNKNISDKMITYFFDHIRNKYFLSTTQINSDFTTLLSRKSGVPVSQIETLFRTITNVQSSQEVEDFQLLSLNEQVQDFYKNKN